jgi:hypothetical protein
MKITHVKPRLVGVVAMIALFTFVPIFVSSLHKIYIDKLVTTEHFFEYESVEPLKAEFQVGEDLTFVSTSIIHRPVHLVFNDILFCDTGTGFSYFSVYKSQNYDVNPRDWDSKQWVYQGPIPDGPATCYLESQIIHTHYTGAEKSQTLIDRNKIFKIVE